MESKLKLDCAGILIVNMQQRANLVVLPPDAPLIPHPVVIAQITLCTMTIFWLDRIVTDLIVYQFMIYFTTLFAKTQQLFFPGIAKTIWDGDGICIY